MWRRSLVLVALLVCAHAAPAIHFTPSEYERQFDDFLARFQKSYEVDEYHVRFENFKHNLDTIHSHNLARDPSDDFSLTLGITQFADLSPYEFRAKYLRYTPRVHRHRHADSSRTRPSLALKHHGPVPASVDWLEEDVVNPAKDQGACGSCWAFATIAAVESAWAIAKNTAPPDLSVQWLMVCFLFCVVSQYFLGL